MLRSSRFSPAITFTAIACALSGCGAQVTGSSPMAPLLVSLNSSVITVPQDGTPVRVVLTIRSSSETALVNFVGLPGGVEEMYATTDTNPSGLLTFTARMGAVAGTYMPTIVVNSAGQTASLRFTMVVASTTAMDAP